MPHYVQSDVCVHDHRSYTQERRLEIRKYALEVDIKSRVTATNRIDIPVPHAYLCAPTKRDTGQGIKAEWRRNLAKISANRRRINEQNSQLAHPRDACSPELQDR